MTKRHVVCVINIRDLRWGYYPGLSGGFNVMTRVLIRKRGRQAGVSESEKGLKMLCYWVFFVCFLILSFFF